MATATCFNLSAFRHRITDMAFDFFQTLHINQRALGDAIIGAIADFHLFDLGGQGGGKFIINPRLHKDAVGANTCLARVTEF